jgi:hypothetical protein
MPSRFLMDPVGVSAPGVGCYAFLSRVHARGVLDNATPSWERKPKMGNEASLNRESRRYGSIM